MEPLRHGDPLVTVGVTTHNEGSRLARCLDSVVGQSLPAQQVEVIVVDDGSADGTHARAQSYAERADWAGFSVLRHRRTGTAAKGRNMILDQARGRYVFLVDGDDYLGPQALEATTAAADKRRADVVVGKYHGVNRPAPNIRDPRNPKGRVKPGEYHSGWLNSLHIQKLFRTEFVRGLPYRFNEQLVYCNDHPFMVAVFLHAGTVARVDDVECYFITLEADAPGHRGHVSRAEISAVAQLQFLHDVFGNLALARGQGGDVAALASRMRVHYWNRFLKNQLPALLLRKTDPQAVTELARQARYMTQLYGAQASQAGLVDEASAMLQALNTEDAESVRSAAAQVRETARRRAAES